MRMATERRRQIRPQNRVESSRTEPKRSEPKRTRSNCVSNRMRPIRMRSNAIESHRITALALHKCIALLYSIPFDSIRSRSIRRARKLPRRALNSQHCIIISTASSLGDNGFTHTHTTEKQSTRSAS